MKRLGLILLFVGQISCNKADSENEVRIQQFLATAENERLSSEKRLSSNNEALRLLHNGHNDSLNRKRLLKVAENFQSLDRYDLFKDAAWLAKRNATLANDSVQMADSYRCLGSYYSKKGIYDSSYYFYLKSIKILDPLKNDYGLMQGYYKLSGLQSDLFDNWNAQKSAVKACEYARKINHVEGEAQALIRQAVIANNLDDHEVALEKCREALAILKDDVNFSKEMCLNTIGIVYRDAKQYQKAIEYFEKALDNKKIRSDNPDFYAVLLNNIAYSKMQLLQYEDVEVLLLNALKIHASANKLPDNTVSIYCNLSEYYRRISDVLKSKHYSQKALQLSYGRGNARSKLAALRQASKSDGKNARTYFNRYTKLEDSLQMADRRTRNQFAQIAFETEEMANEKAEAVQHRQIIGVFAAVSLLLFVLVFVIIRQRAKRKALLLLHEQKKADQSIYRLIHDQGIKIDENRRLEKRRIARELHDGIINRLADARMRLSELGKAKDEYDVRKCIGFISGIHDIEKEIRQVAHDLNKEIFSENRSFTLLLDTLFDRCKKLGEARLFTEADPSFNWEKTDGKIRMNIYRIIEEALHNSYKYAKARNIFVTLTRENDSARILVHDDGVGFDVTKTKKGRGLKSIADRTKLLKGEFKLISGAKEGTILNILLPLT